MDYADLEDGLNRLAYDYLEAHGVDPSKGYPPGIFDAIDRLLDALESAVQKEE